MQIAFVRSKTTAEYPASQKGASKNWREFRLCKRLSFVAYRLRSTRQMKKQYQKNGEHSVHANDCFAQCIGHTVHSEQREGSAAWR
mgnify:CR=1 FL=1